LPGEILVLASRKRIRNRERRRGGAAYLARFLDILSSTFSRQLEVFRPFVHLNLSPTARATKRSHAPAETQPLADARFVCQLIAAPKRPERLIDPNKFTAVDTDAHICRARNRTYKCFILKSQRSSPLLFAYSEASFDP
jgi:hypothetical protein